MSNPGELAIQEASGSRAWHLFQWLLVAALVYVLISAVNVIGGGFKLAAGEQAGQLFEFAANPFVALMVGIVATALIQSSSTVSSVIVGMVAGGLPVTIAVPMIMGANIGTTVTNTLVSLGYVTQREDFRRAFSAATVHDFFNLLAVTIFLPLEIAFGLLEKLALASASLLLGDSSFSMGGFNFVRMATDPFVRLLRDFGGLFPGELGSGLAMIVVGVGLIFLSITWIGRLLKELLVGRAKRILHGAIGRGPLTGIASGTVVTVLVQSSSTTTSLMIPLAGSGAFSLKQIYPFTLGTNIGTCITALLAATAITGPLALHALEIALVHLFFNVLGVTLIFGLPPLRNLPVRGAEWLAKLASENRILAAAWVLGVFVAIPLGLILLGSML